MDIREVEEAMSSISVTDHETIVAAAIRYSDSIFGVAAQPLRHHHIIAEWHSVTGQRTTSKHQQGFWTSSNRFVGREEAFQIARRAGQFDPDNRKSGSASRDLFSEDLW